MMFKNLPKYREDMSAKQLLDMMVAHIDYIEHVEARIEVALTKLEATPTPTPRSSGGKTIKAKSK